MTLGAVKLSAGSPNTPCEDQRTAPRIGIGINASAVPGSKALGGTMATGRAGIQA
jgi:hypothetical protein